MKNIKKYVLVFLGSVSLILGMIGIFLPVLPTTPFLLLAAFCYMRSSRRLYEWIINHKLFGSYIYNYMTYKAIPRRTKVIALLFLWCTLGISIFFVPSMIMKGIFPLIGIGVSIHLLKLKTLEKRDLVEIERAERDLSLK